MIFNYYYSYSSYIQNNFLLELNNNKFQLYSYQLYLNNDLYFLKKKKFKLIYVKFLYEILYKLQVKLKKFKLMKLNWRFNFLSFYNIVTRIKCFTLDNIGKTAEIFHNNLIFFKKFVYFYKKKIFYLLKNKINLFANKILKKTINQLIIFKSIVQDSFNNLKYYSFKSSNDKVIEFNICIKIKKNNIFLVFKNLSINKLIFFISAGRIFKGKKKRNYLAGRFLSKTLLRLIIRFLLNNKNNILLPYYFTIKYDKLLKYFLIKSIFNSLKYFDFPVLFIQNIYNISHSRGLKLRKVRRL